MNVLMFATYSASVPCGDGRYLTVMLGSDAAAACMPSHADWLNDLSSIVPSSATMQPVNLAVVAELAPVAAAELAPAAGAELAPAAGAELVVEAGVVLLPHAVGSNA